MLDILIYKKNKKQLQYREKLYEYLNDSAANVIDEFSCTFNGTFHLLERFSCPIMNQM